MTVGLLAVDGGQSGIKVRLENGSERTEMKFPGVQTDEAVLPQLARVTKRIISETPTQIDTVTVGTTGLVKEELDAGRLAELIDSADLRQLALAHDSVTSYLGALGNDHGAVVAAGTGVVTLGVGPHQVARIDGWGHIMGDAGSGYWIGQQALMAVMRDYDGRGERTALTAVVKERWPDLSEAYIDLQALPDRISTVASFAASVAELADTDQIAAQICARAGKELADSAATALLRVGLGSSNSVPVAAIGGVFEGQHVRASFIHELHSLHSGAQVQAVTGNGLDGVQLLAHLPTDHPLQGLISRYHR
ncbi:N-acetylglucosamine kinase [Glutamicibacter sp. TV12E]|uniref:N-acetylglucosamine kinase n=1 Tax=Glutamicibacter sp. TV12E TaxID=3446362 RepID=UPI004034F053